jgi:hypothetical protein
MCRRNRTVSGPDARYVSIGLDDNTQKLLKLATANLKKGTIEGYRKLETVSELGGEAVDRWQFLHR